jgi:hypothetical protein
MGIYICMYVYVRVYVWVVIYVTHTAHPAGSTSNEEEGKKKKGKKKTPDSRYAMRSGGPARFGFAGR